MPTKGSGEMTNRDRATGRYVDTMFDKPCTCGHTLGVHTADRRAGEQPCLVGQMGDGGVPCDCDAFTKAKKGSR